uniref:Uncharacterized protein n=1 Tax=Chrysemys picta bellii TaxID=8478 RepID=A0A8C3H5T5_CHRPI
AFLSKSRHLATLNVPRPALYPIQDTHTLTCPRSQTCPHTVALPPPTQTPCDGLY